MDRNNRRLFIITILFIFSLLSVGFSSLYTPESSKSNVEFSLEKELLEKSKEMHDKIMLSSLVELLDFQTTLKTDRHSISHYTYLDTNQLLRPPIRL